MADRRAGKVPHVPSKGGAQPRARNNNGQWRKKRSDAGKPRSVGLEIWSWVATIEGIRKSRMPSYSLHCSPYPAKLNIATKTTLNLVTC